MAPSHETFFLPSHTHILYCVQLITTLYYLYLNFKQTVILIDDHVLVHLKLFMSALILIFLRSVSAVQCTTTAFVPSGGGRTRATPRAGPRGEL